MLICMLVAPSPVPLYRSRDLALLSPRVALHWVRPGVYAPLAEWRKLKPWARYLARVHAVALHWRNPVFAYESAAALHGLALFGEPRDIHVVTDAVRSRRHSDVAVHSTRDDVSPVKLGGIAMTSIARTAADLARVLPPAFALATADTAARKLAPAGKRLDLHDSLIRGSNRRGLHQLDWVADRVTCLAESVGESVSRAAIEWLGYDTPSLQIEFLCEGIRDRTDFFWPEHRVIGESDGYGKYDADDAEASKAIFIAEKRREDRLRRGGNGFARWDARGNVDVGNLDAALTAAALPRVHARNEAALATLQSNPRSHPSGSKR